MKVLFIYPNARGYGRIPLGLSILMTMIENNGHQIDLFDTTFILSSINTNDLGRDNARIGLPTDTTFLYDLHSKEEVDEMLREKLRNFAPDIVATGIVEDNYELADHLLQIVKAVDPSITVIAGGTTPTVVPEIIIKNPNIDYVIKGEAELAMEEFVEHMAAGKSVEKIQNLWYIKNGTIYDNPIRPFVDLDILPIQNLDLWNKNHFVRAYDGVIYNAGSFEMSRGCMKKCTYCVNENFQRVLADSGKYFRRKSVDNTIKEIKALKDKFNLEIIFFTDDDFLSISPKGMDEFAERWVDEINLPFWINTTIETINEKRLLRVKKAGICGIGIGLETGSEWLRKKVLGRLTRNKKIIEGFGLMNKHGIRISANNMLGFPGETEEDIFETIKLLKKIKPKDYDVSFVAPYIGTPIHEVAKKLGYIDTWDKPGFEGMAKNDLSFRGHANMVYPHISPERLEELYFTFTDYVKGTLTIPEKFMKSAPGANDDAPPRGDLSKDIADAMHATGTAGVKDKYSTKEEIISGI